MQQAIIPPAAINALLPLFLDNANSVAMIRHSMDVIKAAIQHLNPGESMEVNEARKHKNQELSFNPRQHSNSTSNALATRPTVGTMQALVMEMPEPSDWGWTKETTGAVN